MNKVYKDQGQPLPYPGDKVEGEEEPKVEVPETKKKGKK